MERKLEENKERALVVISLSLATLVMCLGVLVTQ
jgi:hypothetical protein